MLATPAHLDAWYTESGLVDSVTPSTAVGLEEARAVREAVYRLVTDRRENALYDKAAVAVVNDAARRPTAQPQLTPPGRRTTATPQQALSAVARRAVELLGGPQSLLLKECGNPECTCVYVDRSRGARRQWCGMDFCGNRFKAAAYRARKKGTPVAVGTR